MTTWVRVRVRVRVSALAHHSTILAAFLWALVAVMLHIFWETVYPPAQSRLPCWGLGLGRHQTGSEKAVAGCLEVASDEPVPSVLRQTLPTPRGLRGPVRWMEKKNTGPE